MTFDTFAFGAAGFLLSVFLVLVGYMGDRMNKSIDDLRAMLDEKLSELSKTFTAIEKDIRKELNEHDRRITIIEVSPDRRHDDDRNHHGH